MKRCALIFGIAVAAAVAAIAAYESIVKFTITDEAPYVWVNRTDTPREIVMLTATAVTPPADSFTRVTVADYELTTFGSLSFTNGVLIPTYAPVPPGATVTVYNTSSEAVNYSLYLK